MNPPPPTLDYESAQRRPAVRRVIPGFLLVLVLTLWAAETPVNALFTPPRRYGAGFEKDDLLPLIFLTAIAIGAGIGFWRRKVHGFAMGLLLGGMVSAATFFYILWSAM